MVFRVTGITNINPADIGETIDVLKDASSSLFMVKDASQQQAVIITTKKGKKVEKLKLLTILCAKSTKLSRKWQMHNSTQSF
jgi:hypothetical protein